MVDLLIKLAALVVDALQKITATPELYTSAEIEAAVVAVDTIRGQKEALENARADRAAVDSAASDK